MPKTAIAAPAAAPADYHPKCPVCGERMTREHIERKDGTWHHGWTCVHDPDTANPRSIHEVIT